ncbi:MAG: hypothetical protein QXO33_05525, partial [Nitrososphaeria archaeon]
SSAAQDACKLVQSYYVTDALTSIFLRKASIGSPAILLDFAITSISSIAVLLIGIILFKKYLKT